MEQCFEQPITREGCSGGDITKCKSPSAGVARMVNNNSNSSGGFDCNICLDCAQDPVVTLCGHLYCWPCIYKWMQSQITMFESSDQQPQCPMCKTKVSQSTLIPLYGRGKASKPTTKLDVVVPQRPSGPGCGVHTLVTATTSRSPQLHHGQQLHHRGGSSKYILITRWMTISHPPSGLQGLQHTIL